LLPGLGILLCLTAMDWLWLSVLIGRNRIWIAALNLTPLLVVKLLVGPIWVARWGADGMVRVALLGQIGTSLMGAFTAYRQFTSVDAEDS